MYSLRVCDSLEILALQRTYSIPALLLHQYCSFSLADFSQGAEISPPNFPSVLLIHRGMPLAPDQASPMLDKILRDVRRSPRNFNQRLLRLLA